MERRELDTSEGRNCRKNCHMLIKNAAGFFLALTFLAIAFSPAGAYDPLDPNGNITIKWDIVSWTADGYVAAVTMHNFQQYRHIPSPPGWTLGWNWAKKEVIWAVVGGQTTEQGDCSKWKAGSPHCCIRTPPLLIFYQVSLTISNLLIAAKVERWHLGLRILRTLSHPSKLVWAIQGPLTKLSNCQRISLWRLQDRVILVALLRLLNPACSLVQTVAEPLKLWWHGM